MGASGSRWGPVAVPLCRNVWQGLSRSDLDHQNTVKTRSSGRAYTSFACNLTDCSAFNFHYQDCDGSTQYPVSHRPYDGCGLPASRNNDNESDTEQRQAGQLSSPDCVKLSGWRCQRAVQTLGLGIDGPP